MPEVESWSDYRIWLIKTLERLEACINELDKTVDSYRHTDRAEVATLRAEIVQLKVDFGMQKVRVGLIGSGAGAVVGGLIAYVVKHIT